MAEKEIIEMPLGTKEIADTLKLSESAIRKYALELEKAGHEFNKSGTARMFKQDDVELFRKINKLTENSKLNVEHAVTVVMTRNTQMTSSVAATNEVIPTNEVINQYHSEQLALLGNQLKTQNDLMASLVEALASLKQESDKHLEELNQKYEKQLQDNKDLNDKLSLAVNLIQKLDDKVEKIEENEKKGFFKRLFG